MELNETYEWTSESVGPGHPDKVADQISDGILDAYLAVDPKSRVACETLVKGKLVVLAGEITSTETIDYEAVVKQVYEDLGYDTQELVFTKAITEQSPQIAGAVGDQSEGAGDQGIMFGYATNETQDYMPLTLSLARRVERAPEKHRKNQNRSLACYIANELRTDRKTQVTVKYDEFGKPMFISKIVFSSQHNEGLTIFNLRNGIQDILEEELADTNLLSGQTQYLINPAGLWTFGGPEADAGLTGRKIVVDNYGADCPIGGGCYAGKDPSKQDRAAAYTARYIAKNIVQAKLANKAQIQISYAIGRAEPCSFRVKTPLKERENRLMEKEILKRIDLRPRAISERFNLRSPIYQETARLGSYGHIPYEKNGYKFFPWEATDLFSP